MSAVAHPQPARPRIIAVGRHAIRHCAVALPAHTLRDVEPFGIAAHSPLAGFVCCDREAATASIGIQRSSHRIKRETTRRPFLHHSNRALVDDDLAFAHCRCGVGGGDEFHLAIALARRGRHARDPGGLRGHGPTAFRLSGDRNDCRSSCRDDVGRSCQRQLALRCAGTGGDF